MGCDEHIPREDTSDIRNIRRRLNVMIEAEKRGYGPGLDHTVVVGHQVIGCGRYRDRWRNEHAIKDLSCLLDLVEPLFAWDVPNWIRYLRTQGDDQIADALEVLLGFEPYPWSPEAEEGSP